MKTFHNGWTHWGLLLLCFGVAGEAHGQVSSKQFEAKALPALEVEESYDFLRQHTEGLPPRPRDPAMRAGADEIEIGTGWSIEIPADASRPLVSRKRGASAVSERRDAGAGRGETPGAARRLAEPAEGHRRGGPRQDARLRRRS